MISVERRREILQKTRELVSTSRQLLQQLSVQSQEIENKPDRRATEVGYSSPTSEHSTDDG